MPLRTAVSRSTHLSPQMCATSRPPVFVGDVWWVKVDGTIEAKVRPCVILRVHPNGAAVVYGQSAAPRSGGSIVSVVATDRAATLMGLTGSTHFGAGNVLDFVAWIRFRTKAGRCPPGLFPDLKALFEEHQLRKPS